MHIANFSRPHCRAQTSSRNCNFLAIMRASTRRQTPRHSDSCQFPSTSSHSKVFARPAGCADRGPRAVTDNRKAPRPSLFIKGNHEDFVWLDSRPQPEVLPNLSYIRNGCTVDLGVAGRAIRVGGVGGGYGPSDYQRRSDNLARCVAASPSPKLLGKTLMRRASFLRVAGIRFL